MVAAVRKNIEEGIGVCCECRQPIDPDDTWIMIRCGYPGLVTL
jgi:hypothetical protein